MERQSVSPETPAAQGLGEEDPVSGGLVPVINPSTNYEQQPDGSAAVNATGFRVLASTVALGVAQSPP
jgi:hypothetical protein